MRVFESTMGQVFALLVGSLLNRQDETVTGFGNAEMHPQHHTSAGISSRATKSTSSFEPG